MSEQKRYIGDGIYVKFDGFYLWLLTGDPNNPTNKIALEDTVMVSLLNFAIECFGKWIVSRILKDD